MYGLTALMLVFSALYGSVPFTVLVPRLIGAADPRSGGTYNASVSNAWMVSGTVAGILITLGEASKGLLAVGLPLLLGLGDPVAGISLFFTVVATRFSPWIRFSGGSARTAGGWGLLLLSPLSVLALALIWPVATWVSGRSSVGNYVTFAMIGPVVGIVEGSVVGLMIGGVFGLFYSLVQSRYFREAEAFHAWGRYSA